MNELSKEQLKEAIKAVAKERGLTKNEVYMQYINKTEKD